MTCKCDVVCKCNEKFQGIKCDDAEPVKSHGKTIGEVYKCSMFGGWGYFCYATDNGAEGCDTKEEAWAECYYDHVEYVADLRRTFRRLARELRELTA